MAKRSEGEADRSSPQAGAKARPARPSATRKRKGLPVTDAQNRSRVDRFVEIIDHCAAAQEAADGLGEKFLSYLLAMAIQESRAAVRRNGPLEKLAH